MTALLLNKTDNYINLSSLDKPYKIMFAKTNSMKYLYQLTSLIVVVSISISCELVPDLSPISEEGSDISVFNIMDTIMTDYNGGFSKEYDLNNDGDIEFNIINKSTWTGGVIPCPERANEVTLGVRGHTLFSIVGEGGFFLMLIFCPILIL